MTEEATQNWPFLMALHFTIVYRFTFSAVGLAATGGSAGMKGLRR